ncbi:MAG: hypothetical protein WB696_13380 [Chthoniobacterales bacterium]
MKIRSNFGRAENTVFSAGQVDGRNYPDREAFPASGAWGKSGWTFTNNSHRDPLAGALAKARRLIGGTERTGEQL